MVEFIKACKMGDINRVQALFENKCLLRSHLDIHDPEILKYASFMHNHYSNGLLAVNVYNGYLQCEPSDSLILVAEKTMIENGLIIACQIGNLKLAEYMIQLGAQNSQNGLLFSALKGHLGIAELMLSLGANNFEETLFLACYQGNFPMAEYMLANGANDVDDALMLLSGTTMESKECKEFIETFLITRSNDNLDDCLYEACRVGNLMITKLVIAYGAEKLDTALYYACSNKHKHVVQFLLNAGAESYHLSLAATVANFEIEFEHDPKSDQDTSIEIAVLLLQKSPPLHVCNHKPMVYRLLEHGIGIDMFTPLSLIEEVKVEIQTRRVIIQNLGASLSFLLLFVPKDLFHMISEYSLY